MDKYLIQREASSDVGTPGEMFYPDGRHLCYTIERPATGDRPCIPADTYTVIPHVSPKFPNGVWEITNVPNRTGILIHNANYMLELEGCVAVGDSRSMFGEYPGVLHSRTTVDFLHGVLPVNFLLEVHDA